MNISEYFKSIVLPNLGINLFSIDTSRNFRELGINSIAFIRLIVLTEETFDIEFEDDYLDYAKYNTVQEFLEYLEQKITESEC